MIDWFCRAPKQVTIIAARLKGVLQNNGIRRFVDCGCYLCMLRLQKGVIRALSGVIGRDTPSRPGFEGVKNKPTSRCSRYGVI